MCNLNSFFCKAVLHIWIILGVLILFLYVLLTNNYTKHDESLRNFNAVRFVGTKRQPTQDYNLWFVFTKVVPFSNLQYNFHNLIASLLKTSRAPMQFNVITDQNSRRIAEKVFADFNRTVNFTFYEVKEAAGRIKDIVEALTPHFSSSPGTYYSDALFYMSLGLHRIAPKEQTRIVMLDCDLLVKEDVGLLFDEFRKFKPTALYGLAPELSPVYRHILHSYRLKNKNTFGNPYHEGNTIANVSHPHGYQGYNSGVILLDLEAIRRSKSLSELFSRKTIEAMTKEFGFRGHLGDQDFYTLVGYVRPDLIQTLNCGFNRQLCTWWRDHGYGDVFKDYFKCKHKVVVVHGNCNTNMEFF